LQEEPAALKREAGFHKRKKRRTDATPEGEAQSGAYPAMFPGVELEHERSDGVGQEAMDWVVWGFDKELLKRHSKDFALHIKLIVSMKGTLRQVSVT
jgi:hypothetical protein